MFTETTRLSRSVLDGGAGRAAGATTRFVYGKPANLQACARYKQNECSSIEIIVISSI